MILNRVVIAYPSGNTTAIIFDDISGLDKKRLNRALMSACKLLLGKTEIEQCCAVVKSQKQNTIGRVEMFGEEFCGNATRSCVYVLAHGVISNGLIESSGTDQALRFNVENNIVSVEVPFPHNADIVSKVDDETCIVMLDGIVHVVKISDDNNLDPRHHMEKLLEDNFLNVQSYPAVGVSIYSKKTNKARFCVWVKKVATIFDETACGSGTAAIGMTLSYLHGNEYSGGVIQPSGETIAVSCGLSSGQRTYVTISGAVDILYDGRVVVEY